MTFKPEDITIAIPVFERYDFFEDAVNSAIYQTVACNIIIVDNCSTHTLFEDFVERQNLPNLKYYKNSTNLGAIGNWNKCIDLSATNWVTILHSDDTLSKVYIEMMLEVINDNVSEVAILCKDEAGKKPTLILDGAEKIRYRGHLTPIHFLFGNLAGFPGNIFNKDRIQNIRFRNLQGASDYAFWYELSLKRPLLQIDNILAFYRQSNDQDSASMDIEEIVIKPAYILRKEEIGFRNKYLKLLSMYELYKLNQHYVDTYGRKKNDINNFSVDDINVYFNFFNKKISKIIIQPSLRVLIFLTKKMFNF
ncbi:glycosyltransferase family 2 protein [Pedobacter frigidisoli]|uniref:Glycosyltransferase family 2 protein n=1 Tax=Pedobacter frigidisoli TaxID=2530455 RepID=A0A4R0NMB4_9SPHI|nr:glycosyltransferase [Pedobacter frigidisoli]TCD01961.1 glycosyltransferase family 2 protein [Pedobacter frigidisoli]